MKKNKREEVLEALQNVITTRESIRKTGSINVKNNLFGVSWTLTQLHIVGLLHHKEMVNNTSLAEELNLSKPAITKAIKKLLENHMVEKKQKKGNKKEVYYILTRKGVKLAFLHQQLHKEAKRQYIQLLEPFSDEQLETITTFLNSLTEYLEENHSKTGGLK